MSIVAKKIMMGSGAAGDPVDDEFNRTSFLSHFDGANNGVNNAFDDGSASNHTITANGDVTQGSFGPFARPDGEWGVSFDGSGDYLTLPNTLTRFTIANKDSQAATFEAFVFVKAYTANGSHDYFNSSIYVKGNIYLNFSISPEGYVDFYHYDGSVRFLSTSVAVPLNTWTHVAATIAGGVTKIYIDGVLRATGTWYGIHADGQSEASRVGLGAASGSVALNAIVSNLRLIEGTAIYTGNFTPPTAKLTAVTNTKLLTCQSNRFVDNSDDGLAVTPSGNPAVTAFGPFLTSSVYDAAVNGASLFVTAQGDYLSFSTAGTALQTPSTFTAEGWVFLTQAPASTLTVGIISCGNNGVDSGSNSWSLEVRADLKPRIVSSGYTAQTAQGTAMRLNEWCHVAMTYDGTTWSLYQNGVRSATSTTQTLSGTTHSQGYVGRAFYDPNRVAPNSYFSDVRMVTSLLYTGTTYTVPTAPVTAITNTQLLLNMADGQAIDSAAQLNMVLIDDAKLSNAKAKFGNTSLLLDGSGRVHLTGRVLDFGAGDFTAELFINITTGGADEIILEARNSNDTSGPMFTLETNSSDKIIYRVSAAARITSGSALSTNTWYHIAVCRSGTSTKLFIDGTQSGSTYSDSTVYTQPNNYCVLGGYYNSATYDFDGYIDEVRITKGFARYTSNFTAPAEPFADKGQ